MIGPIPTELWIADIINAVFLFIGTLFLIKFLQGSAIKKMVTINRYWYFIVCSSS